MKVISVLRSGADFKPIHVHRLYRMVTELSPGLSFLCLSDQNVPGVPTTALNSRLPGWWSKIELFRPDVAPGEDILYFDLDVTIRTDMRDMVDALVKLGELVFASDSQDKRDLNSSMMFVPIRTRRYLWAMWNSYPMGYWLNKHRLDGDQGFFEEVLPGPAVPRFQNAFPGLVTMYHDRDCPREQFYRGGVQIYQRNPRPWDDLNVDTMGKLL